MLQSFPIALLKKGELYRCQLRAILKSSFVCNSARVTFCLVHKIWKCKNKNVDPVKQYFVELNSK